MLNSLPSRKCHERDGKEDLAGVWETRTIGSGLRGHSDNQIRPLKPDDRPAMTKEYVRWVDMELFPLALQPCENLGQRCRGEQ